MIIHKEQHSFHERVPAYFKHGSSRLETIKSMAQAICCVRHVQGLHNLGHANHHLPDPGLTPLGEEQARGLARRFLDADKIELVLASPLQPTIQTALA